MLIAPSFRGVSNMGLGKNKTIKRTMKTHVACGLGGDPPRVAIKTVSCHCEVCLSGEICTNGWNEVTTPPVPAVHSNVVVEVSDRATEDPLSPESHGNTNNESANETEQPTISVVCDIGEFVAV